ncbi:MAG: cytochrome-c oxidase, cbb3-type subunit III [Burkholderiales bacterium]
MSDFTSAFWSPYVAILTIVSILACGVLLYVMGRMRVTKQPGKTGTTGHVWDEDLAEYNNPLPRWWSWLFYLTIAFSFVYLALYPGLGNFAGLLGWTSTDAYAKERAAFEQSVGPLYAKYAAMDAAAISKDPTGHAIGERLFLNNCAQCHGSDAGGSRGFPNLRDTDWLYGGAPEAIVTSITEGRNGIMPAFGPSLGAENIDNVVNYVRSLSGLPVDSLKAQLGKPIFLANCAACHGLEGKGNPAMGAPNLTDNIWLWGGSPKTVTETVTYGRGNPAANPTRMPSHKDLLDPTRIKLVGAYVWSLSNPQK